MALPVRSAKGLAAEYLLHDVDLVVWTEGGQPEVDLSASGDEQTDEDAAAVPVSKYADDVQFWTAIFRHRRPRLRIKVKPAGSKNDSPDSGPDRYG